MLGLIEELRVFGVDVDDAMERFMGNTALYERMLKKLPDVIKNADVQPDFDCTDYADITEKGTCHQRSHWELVDYSSL